MNPIPALVLGMHRSGTSAVTGCLTQLGLAPPRPAEQVDAPGNPAHLEAKRIVIHNDELLACRGGEWQYPGENGFDPDAAWILKAQALIDDVFDSDAWVLKDPRFCMVLDAWAVLPAETRFVLVGREPVAVAESLHRRDGFSIGHGLALWDHYNATAEAALQGKPVYAVTFEQLRAHPERHLEGLSDFFGLSALPDHGQRVGDAMELLDPALGQDSTSTAQSSDLEQRWSHLQRLEGPHSTLRSRPFPSSLLSRELLAAIRERDELEHRNRALERRPLKIAAARMVRVVRRPQHAPDLVDER